MQRVKPIILAIDSSGPTLRVGVSNGEKHFVSSRKGIKQEQFFMPLIERTLAKAHARLTDIKRVFFVRGPGRFTGIRISLTFASMLRMLAGAEPASATVFEILHWQTIHSAGFARWKKQHPQSVIAVVWHAFREEYFLQFFGPVPQAPKWLSKQELLAQLAACPFPLYVAGLDKEETALTSLLSNRYQLAPLPDCRVRPQTLLKMALDPKYEKNALEPLYLKPARFELGR